MTAINPCCKCRLKAVCDDSGCARNDANFTEDELFIFGGVLTPLMFL